MEKTTRKKRYFFLDLVKGISIINVILMHTAYIPSSFKRSTPWAFIVTPCVSCFIICSVFAYSFSEDAKNGTIEQWFSKKVFRRRANRLFVPFLISIIALYICLIISGLRKFNFTTFMGIILAGGRGPAAYYVLVAFQMIVIFPFALYFYKRNKPLTIIFIAVFSIAYEVLARYVLQLESTTYSALIFRFLIQIAFGLLLYDYRETLHQTMIPVICIAIGFVYTYSCYYTSYTSKLVLHSSTQSGLASFWAFGFLCYAVHGETLLKKLESSDKFMFKILNGCLQPLYLCGKASFHIMLTQMIYYYFMRRAKYEFDFANDNKLLGVIADLLILLTIGILFYLAEQAGRKGIKYLKTKRSNET